jgi:predicted Zn-dependent peptidase
MINFEKYSLANGLRLIVHQDKTTPMIAIDVVYDVGARDESPQQTGFAHLFEHLMFSGSLNAESYDEPLQRAGGDNNAYTTNDLTSYHCQLPAVNLETALWLESDRMLSLNFNENSLQVQQKVVSEEFKEHYINRPYGMVWHQLRSLAYKKHPYKWMTIGQDLSHIEQANLNDVKNFFFKHYTPANAILTVAGNVEMDEIIRLTEKWFGDLPPGMKYVRNLPEEPVQSEASFERVKADVPLDAIYKSWHVCSRLDPRFHSMDLISDLLGNGQSSRLHEKLVKQQQLFSHISCAHSGSFDPGLITIEGKLIKGVTLEQADEAIQKEIDNLKQSIVDMRELDKVKNRVESLLAFEDISLLNRANNLGIYELLGDASLINQEMSSYEKVSTEDIKNQSNEIFQANNSSTLYYQSSQ